MEVVVPDLGDFSDVEIIDVLVKPGDRVEADQGLVTLETEKATMDVPSPAEGRVAELKVKVGDRVSKGSPVLVLQQEGEAAKNGAAPAPDAEPAATEPSGAASPETAAGPASGPAPAAEGPAADAPVEDALAAGGEPEVVAVPDLGDFSDVEIIDVLVGPGDTVAADQGLVTLETEKATMDVPSPKAGSVVELRVKLGDRVSAGDAVLVLKPAGAPKASAAAGLAGAAAGSTGAAPASEEGTVGAPPRTAERASAPSRAAPATSFLHAHASPSLRKLARELGVDLGRVVGTGRKGRITPEDVKGFVKEALKGGGGGSALPQIPAVDFAKFGKVELTPLTRIQKISGPRLHAAWINVPHVTQHDEADITELEQLRGRLKGEAEARGIRLTPLAFVIRGCALALAEMPLFKSSLAGDGENLVTKEYTHIGFAVDTPKGLVVPVIRDADRKDVYEIASALGALSARAREGKLSADDMQGGVFSVSSLGGIGGRFFTPIINVPEVAILGVSRNQWQPVYRDGGFIPRLMLPLSLSYDHRVIDGAKAAHFTTRLGEILADAKRLVEAVP